MRKEPMMALKSIKNEFYNRGFFKKESPLDTTILCRVEDTGEESSMTFHSILPGIDFIYNQFSSKKAVEAEYREETKNVIEINHCFSGRFGCVVNGRQVYLGEGEIEANMVGVQRENPEFPLGFYRGVEILIDPDTAKESLCVVFPEFVQQIDFLLENIKKNQGVAQIKKSPELQHIFGEMYQVNPRIQQSYLKLKILEVMLLIQIVPWEAEKSEKRYFRKQDYEKVKAIHHEVLEHLDQHISIPQIVERYEIGQTTFQNCFREIYGKPYYTFLRHYKMHKAVHYLEETDFTITKIAGILGYDNVSKFGSAFKSIIGCTPREYKKSSVRMEHLLVFGVEIED